MCEGVPFVMAWGMTKEPSSSSDISRTRPKSDSLQVKPLQAVAGSSRQVSYAGTGYTARQ